MEKKLLNIWSDDLMDRRSSGNFLYNLVKKKYESTKTNTNTALCIAVDAEWGMGKTYFIERWSTELENIGHAIIRFDAWKNDLTDEPLIGFMATMKDALEPWIRSMPIAPRAKSQLISKTKTVVKSGGKALVPLIASVSKDFAARYISEESTELIKDYWDPKTDSIEKKANHPALSESALNKFFEASLKQHTTRQKSITQLKLDIGDLVKHLDAVTNVQLPIFVFIDELDRCRPDYAIRLLEGIKHLFNAPGMCFIVSTNLTQLAESVKSIYGAGFNGYHYLKRFFDLDYTLPPPNDLAHAKYLLQGSVFKTIPIQTGLPNESWNRQSKTNEETIAENFASVSSLFILDLRSQKQVFMQAESALSAIPAPDSPIHCFYLFCLAAISHKHPKLMDTILNNKPFNASQDLINHTSNGKRVHHFYDDDGRASSGEVDLLSTIDFYNLTTKMTSSALVKASQRNTGAYPNLLHLTIAENSPEQQLKGLKSYASAIRLAGHLRT